MKGRTLSETRTVPVFGSVCLEETRRDLTCRRKAIPRNEEKFVVEFEERFGERWRGFGGVDVFY